METDKQLQEKSRREERQHCGLNIAALGCVIGLLGSYLLKPATVSTNILGWYVYGIRDKELAPTIIICAVLGYLVGLAIEYAIRKQNANRS